MVYQNSRTGGHTYYKEYPGESWASPTKNDARTLMHSNQGADKNQGSHDLKDAEQHPSIMEQIA